ncbi:MAG TPA: MauE/DoxX family redox-associated membrane protein [Thermoanaerobaculia bacterium]
MGAQQAVAPAAANRTARVTRETLRLAIGLVLFATAAGKFLDIAGFARILESYEAFPRDWSLRVAWLVPSVELLLALWLFSSRRLRGAAWSALLMHLFYAAWSATALIRGPRLSNCGCFGIFLARPLTWATVGEDLAMAALSAALLRLARRAP